VIWHNLVAGLTVSFVAISLGAAFGILSGRGAFAGIISAGIIAFITASLGGTRVQTSGPTAPMTAVSAVVVAFAYDQLLAKLPGANSEQFIDLVLILTGLVMLLMAVLRLGRFIQYVPKVVVSGFMNGIAILIWVDQLRKLAGWGGKTPFAGDHTTNIVLAGVTFALVMAFPFVIRRISKSAAVFLPGTLLTIIGVTLVANVLRLDVELVNLDTTVASVAELRVLVANHIPSDWSWTMVALALPFALQLAMLGYLDTLLTSLVVDKLNGEETRKDKELAAQGVANGLIAFVGGIPGAQATIRSVLILKEGATLRLAGIMVGVFVLVEMVLFQQYISLIPNAVFAGLLFKVGWDVFDWLPFRRYTADRLDQARLSGAWLRRPIDPRLTVTHTEALFIAGTTTATIVWDLNVAVIGFVTLFYLLRLFYRVRRLGPIRDLELETAFADEE
jgi:SulP family sulfate permease